MTKSARNRLSVLAWIAAIFCSVVLLISAIAAAEHKRENMTRLDNSAYITAPTAAAGN
jgi:hypothetical protein